MREASKDLERAIELASDVRGGLVGSGASFAMIYVDAAIRSMRHARAALIRHGTCDSATSSDDDGWHRLVFADGMPTAVLLRRDPRTDVWLRGRIEGAEVVRTDGADVDWAWPGAVDLGADLLGSPEARAFAASPIGSAMLMDALAYGSWFKPASATRWTTGRAAARAIVVALAAGAAVGSLAPTLAGARVDRDVLLLIESLGWRRDPASRWRVRAANGAPAEIRGRMS